LSQALLLVRRQTWLLAHSALVDHVPQHCVGLLLERYENEQLWQALRPYIVQGLKDTFDTEPVKRRQLAQHNTG